MSRFGEELGRGQRTSGGGDDGDSSDEPDGPGGGVDLGGTAGDSDSSDAPGAGGGSQDSSGGGGRFSDDPTGGRGGDSDGGGGGGTPTDSVTRDRGGAGAGGGGEPTVGVGDSDDSDGDSTDGGLDEMASDTDSQAPGVVDRARGVVGRAGDAVQDVREFQRDTTPVEDAGQTVRDRLGIPGEGELAASANERIADALGTSPREARLDVREAATDTAGDAVGAAADAVPGGRDTLAGAAAVGAVAEPTPVGEALVFGSAAAGGLAGSTASDPEQGEELVPESPFDGPEIDAPEEPGGQSSELGVGEGRATEELPVPAGDGRGELAVPTDGDTSTPDLTAAESVFGRQRGRSREQQDGDTTIIDPDDIIEEPREPEQDPPSTRERQRRDDLDVFERDFPTGESTVIGRETEGSEPEVDTDGPTVEMGDPATTASSTPTSFDIVGGRGGGDADTGLPDIITEPETGADAPPDTGPEVAPEAVPVNIPDFSDPTTTPDGTNQTTTPRDVGEPTAPGTGTSGGNGTRPRRPRFGPAAATDTDDEEFETILSSEVIDTGVAQGLDEVFDRLDRF